MVDCCGRPSEKINQPTLVLAEVMDREEEDSNGTTCLCGDWDLEFYRGGGGGERERLGA